MVDAETAQEFYAPALLRLFMPIGAAAGLLNATFAVKALAAGVPMPPSPWFHLVAGLWFAGYFGWYAQLVWTRPVVRITSDAVEIRHPGRRRVVRLAFDELAGMRWQDSFDLRLCQRAGGEQSVFLKHVGRTDRARLATILAQRLHAAARR